MHFQLILLQTLFVLARLVKAQSALVLTSAFTTLTSGQPYNITWSGGNTSQPVEIILRFGTAENLSNVAVLTDNAIGGTYTWNVPVQYTTEYLYAVEITQGSDIDFSSQFSIASPEPGSETTSSSISSNSISSLTPSPSSFSPSSSAKTSASSSLSASNDAAIGTAIPFGLLLVGVVSFFIWRYRRTLQKPSESATAPQIAGEKPELDGTGIQKPELDGIDPQRLELESQVLQLPTVELPDWQWLDQREIGSEPPLSTSEPT